jgi:hypothetical protein
MSPSTQSTVAGPSTVTSAARSASALSNNPMLTFVPWVIFWVVAGPRDWEVACGCSLLTSVLLLMVGSESVKDRPDGRPSISLQPPKLLDAGTTLFFAALVIVGLFADRHSLIGLEKYSQAISSGALFLIVAISLAAGHPFTEQYAKAGLPPEQTESAFFRRMMVTMSGVWAAIFAVMTILGLVAETGITGAGSSDLLNWYIPIGLVVVGLKFNAWYPAVATRSPPSGQRRR